MPGVQRVHRWKSAIAPVVDAVGREPEIQASLRDEDASAILAWVDRHLVTSEDALIAHRDRCPRFAEIAERLEDTDLLEEMLEQIEHLNDAAGGDQWSIDRREEDLEDRLSYLRRSGIAITREDIGELDRYTRRLRHLRKEVDRWHGVRVDVRDVAGVEPKPSRRGDAADLN